MANKTVDFTGKKILSSQIADFYTRLNNLRSLNGGTTTVAFSAPSVGSVTTPTTIVQAKEAVLQTKSALSFLASVNISSWEPEVPQEETLIEAKKTVAPIEWQVGQLESACFTNFTTNRSGVNVSNFTNFNLTPVASFTSVKESHCPSVGSCVAQKTANHTSNCGNYLPAQFVSVNNGFGCFAVHNANFVFVHVPNFISWTHFYLVHSSHRAHVKTSQNQNCATYGTNFNGTHYVTNNSAHRVSVRSSNHDTNFTAQFITMFSPNVCNTVNSNVCYAQFSAQYVTQHGTFFASNCSSVFTNFGCSTVHTSVKSTNKNSNCVGNNSSNFSSNAATFFANHSSFTVTPTL